MRIVDLSAPIAPSPEGTPAFLRTDIDYGDHGAGAAQIQALLGVPAELLRDGEGWAVETFTRFGTHDSTHVDAPSTTPVSTTSTPPPPILTRRYGIARSP